MTNGLVAAIQEQIDPFYVETREVIAKNRIYLHQFDAIRRLQELGEYPISTYVGETDPKRDLLRFDDGDYSKCPEKVNSSKFSNSSRSEILKTKLSWI